MQSIIMSLLVLTKCYILFFFRNIKMNQKKKKVLLHEFAFIHTGGIWNEKPFRSTVHSYDIWADKISWHSKWRLTPGVDCSLPQGKENQETRSHFQSEEEQDHISTLTSSHLLLLLFPPWRGCCSLTFRLLVPNFVFSHTSSTTLEVSSLCAHQARKLGGLLLLPSLQYIRYSYLMQENKTTAFDIAAGIYD